jgi:hypothetical protein
MPVISCPGTELRPNWLSDGFDRVGGAGTQQSPGQGIRQNQPAPLVSPLEALAIAR